MVRPSASLYKYRSLSGPSRERTLEALGRIALWYASPSSFNDPFDCRLPVPATLSRQSWKNLLPRLLPSGLKGVGLSAWDPATAPPDRLTRYQWNRERPALLADMSYLAATANLPPSAMWYWTGRWLFEKSREWSYECEWRSIYEASGLAEFRPGTFKSVVVDAMTPPEDLALVRTASKDHQPPVPLWRAQPRKSTFGL